MNGYTHLSALFNQMSLPFVILDAEGQVQAATLAGKTLYHQAVIDWQPLPGASATDLMTLMPIWSGKGIQGWAATATHRVQCLPFQEISGESRLWLSWLPVPAETASTGTRTDAPSPHTQAGEEQLRFLQAVSRAVNSSLIMEDIFEALGEVLQDHIPYQEAVIVILDDTQNGIKTLVRIAEGGELAISGEYNSFAGYEPLVDQMLRQPASRLYAQGELPDSLLLAEDAAAALVVPLINKGVVIGLIAMTSTQQEGFLPQQEALLNEVSAQLAVAVENAKFYWQTQAQASREFLINQLTRSIRQSLEIDMILGTAVWELGKVLGVSRCFISYFSPDGQEKAFQYQLPGTPSVGEADLAWEKEVFRLRKEQSYNPFILNDMRDCPPQWQALGLGQASDIKSLAIVPILIRDELAGIIALHQCDAYRAWVMEDIELLKALAEHLGVALNQAQLFLVLDEQKRDLEKTLEELQQAQLFLIQSEKMAVLGQFVAGIAHEVNTPLGTIISNNATLKLCVDKLKSMIPPTDALNGEEPGMLSPAQLFTSVDNLFSLNKLASTRIQDIVKNLRNFARLDESELKTVDLREGIESTILLIQSAIDPDIEIVRRYDPALPAVQCFPGLLNQVFMNLLVNAAHALQDVKGVSPFPPTITIHTRLADYGHAVLIVIQDTGKGIPAENLVKIFDPGFTTKGAGVGTGLGLALCYRIVEKHRGRIWVESVVNEGTRFFVEIPLAPLGAPA